MLIDCAAYREGRRLPEGRTPTEAARELDDGSTFAWVGLSDPTPTELNEVGAAFGIHELALGDAMSRSERPKVEHLGGSNSVVVRTAHYDDEREAVEFGQLTALLGPNWIVVVRIGRAAQLTGVRKALEATPDELGRGPHAVLVAILTEVVASYLPVMAGIEDDIGEVEDQVFNPDDHPSGPPGGRVYYLLREVLGLQRAIVPLRETFDHVLTDEQISLPSDLAPYFSNLADSLRDSGDRVANARELLTSVLNANLTQVSLRQNEDMRKMSAWAAILAFPTMVAGIYGMNFRHMPELTHPWGYKGVLIFLAIGCSILYRLFRRSGWL